MTMLTVRRLLLILIVTLTIFGSVASAFEINGHVLAESTTVLPTESVVLDNVDHVRMAPPTVPVDDEMTAALVDLLTTISEDIDTRTFAVTDLEQRGEWYLVSVAGLVDLADLEEWNLHDHGRWFGLAILTKDEQGRWTGSIEGADDFQDLLMSISSDVLSPTAVTDLIGGYGAQSSGYIFPWEPGTSMQYGVLGVHDAGFAGVIPGWKAVDFLSDGNTALGRAPNRLLAANSGSITYICRGTVNVAARIGDLMYVHLLDNSTLTYGRYFSQGQVIGQLKTGSFSDRCGWASQAAGWFHVHWAFPNSNPFRAGGWELGLHDGIWRRGAEERRIHSWLRADPPPPSPPVLVSPANEAIAEEGQNIILSWSATGAEYRGEISGGPEGPQSFGWQSGTTRTISAPPAGYIYLWRVQARNASGQSAWSSSRTFTVRPAAPTNLSAQAWACDRVLLTWTDNSGGEEGYRIYRNGSPLAVVGANSTGYIDNDVGESASYDYFVRAYRGTIESASSATTTVVTPVCGGDPPIPRYFLPMVQR